MATWTNIPDAVLEPGKPARSVDALALRDNAIAIARGADNAPRILGKAAEKLLDMPVLNVVASDAYNITRGIRFESHNLSATTGEATLARRVIPILYTGSMRFLATKSGAQSYTDVYLYKNGVLVQEWLSLSNSSHNFVVDINVSPGDFVEWWHKGLGTTINNVSAKASDHYTPATFFIAESDL